MIVYSGIKNEFLIAVEQDSIAKEIEENIYNKMHKKTAQNEFRSWENSLEYMYKVLNDNAIPENSGIAIEYNIPQTSKRVDFIISGYGENQSSNVVIIELKQWDKVETVEGQDALVKVYMNGTLCKVVHPSYQAWSYAAMIYDYNQNVQLGNIVLHPCAYMHNYRKNSPEKLEQKQYKEYVKDAPVFARGEVLKLREFIKKFIKTGDDEQLLYDIDNGKIKPSKSLQDSIKSMIEGNLDDVLEIRDTANLDMKDIDYDIRIMDSPNEVRDLIIERNKSRNQSRILAGYCWAWLKEGQNNSDVHDIKIGDFEMSWNLGNTSTFAIDENSVNEIGCIHTSQGLEFDYAGVIIGDDLRYENGHIVTDFTKRAKTDQSLRGIKKLYQENPEQALKEADEIIKNTYRTLMTRGMKGCYVYCTDKNLAKHLRECLK